MKKIIVFIFFPILLTSLGELALKNTINQMHLKVTLFSIPQIIFNPFVLLSISCIVIGGILWLVGMSKFELSFMYPFLVLNYVLIILGSIFFLHEIVTIYTYVAIFFIVCGLILISRSKYSETHEER